MLPDSARQLSELMTAANARAEKISAVDLRRLHRVLELAPEDMTVTVESGITLGALQAELASHRQWLPIDPPNAGNISIHDLLSKDLSGPRRFGYGTIREHLIGMKVALADGRIIKSGGKVVKNVAGYDLAKLFIGARQSLGIIVEATFKLRPLPDMELFVSARVDGVTKAADLLRAVLNSDLTPTVLDLYRDSGASDFSIVVGFAGTRAEVEWQLTIAQQLDLTTPAGLDYETQFWSDSAPVNRLSILSSRVAASIAELGLRPFLARAGNGIIYFRGDAVAQQRNLPTEMMRRIKGAYDPKNILPELTL